jgi:O-antigen biosynthesis protein
MDDIKTINSQSYWENRFQENWQSLGGPSQSSFFAHIAVADLPSWFMQVIDSKQLTIVDWGCAQGDGTAILKEKFKGAQIAGVDFSQVAVSQAKIRYPELTFLAEDWLVDLESEVQLKPRYDVIFSSNTLEHFHNPYQVLEKISNRANKAIVLALPYREMNRIDEHFYTFAPGNIPLRLPNEFRLVWTRVLDCSDIPDTLWSGEQILLLYANTEWYDSLNLFLQDILVSATQILSPHQAQTLLDDRKRAAEDLANLDMQLMQISNDRDNAKNEIAAIKRSLSWRITRPLRLLRSAFNRR